MNIKNPSFERKTASLLSAIGNPFRLRILMEIGTGESCVCHLEAALKKRQAYISQHLMALREVGLLETRRDGKYIFYRLADPELLSLIRAAARLTGLEETQLPEPGAPAVLPCCECPHCGAGETVSKREAAMKPNNDFL